MMSPPSLSAYSTVVLSGAVKNAYYRYITLLCIRQELATVRHFSLSLLGFEDIIAADSLFVYSSATV